MNRPVAQGKQFQRNAINVMTSIYLDNDRTLYDTPMRKNRGKKSPLGGD